MLLVYSQTEAPQVQWTATGRRGVEILRKCAFAQHVAQTYNDSARRLAVDQTPGAALKYSGTSKCLLLLQGDLEGGCLGRAAAAFLEAAWAELRELMLKELRDLGKVMAHLEPSSGGESGWEAADPGAVSAALLHLWRRSRVWVALQQAPADLLGGLNGESLAEALAPGPARTLHSTTGALTDAGQAALAQLGGILQGGLKVGWELRLAMRRQGQEPRGAANKPREQSDGRWDAAGPPDGAGIPGAELGPGSSAAAQWEAVEWWLLCFRVYLVVHGRMMARASGSGWRRSSGPIEPINDLGPHTADDEGREGAGERPLCRATVGCGADVPPPPELLLGRFVSACAGSTAATVLSSSGNTAYAELLLGVACGRVVAQVRGALAPDLSEADLERRIQQLLPPPLNEAAAPWTPSGWAPGTAAAAFTNACAAAPGPLPSHTGALPSDNVASQQLRFPRGGLAAAPFNPSPLPSLDSNTSAALRRLLDDNSAATATSAAVAPAGNVCNGGVDGTGDGGDCGGGGSGGGASASSGPGESAAVTLLWGALLAEISPQRLSRLSGSPGLLSLQLQLASALRPQVGNGSPGTDRCATGRDGNAEQRHALSAALVYGVCYFLHQTHDRLAAAYCTSGISPPPIEQAAFTSDSLSSSSNTSSGAVLQPPAEAVAWRFEAVAAHAGAAALAAAGVTPAQANGSAAVREVAAARAACWVAGSTGGSAAGLAACEAARQRKATEAAGAGAWGSPAWAREIEIKAASVALSASGAMGNEQIIRVLDTTASAEGAVAARVLERDDPRRPVGSPKRPPEAILLQALLLSAGRLRLLGTSLYGARVLPSYRLGEVDPAHSGSAGVETASAILAGVGLMAAAAAGFRSKGSKGAAAVSLWPGACSQQAEVGAVSAHDLASSPTGRALLLHSAMKACAAATNRLAHATAMHAAGSGGDLRPLCGAHSDAVTLGAAAQALLSLAAGAMGSLVACRGGQCWSGRQEAPAWAAFRRPAVSAKAAKIGFRGQCCPGQLTRMHSASAQAEARGAELQQARATNWRRSLRQIMPCRSEQRAGSGARAATDEDKSAAAAACAATGIGPKAGSLAAPGPRPIASRACWGSDTIDPVPLPPPAPLCSIATQHLDAEAADIAAAGRSAATASPWPWSFDHVVTPRVTRPKEVVAAAAACSSRAGSGDASGSGDARGLGKQSSGGSEIRDGNTAGGGFGLAAAVLEALLQGGGTGGRGPLLVGLGAADVGSLRALRGLCEELQAAAVRAAELLEAEMDQRAAIICRTNSSNSGGSGAAPAARQLAASLLGPLREALHGLHPASQAELLRRGFCAVLGALRRHLCGSGSGGGWSPRPAGAGGRGAGRRIADAGVSGPQPSDGLAVVEDELAAGWRQVEAAAAAGGGGPAAVTGLSPGYGCDLASIHSALEAQIRSLRNEVGAVSSTVRPTALRPLWRRGPQ